MHFSHCILFYFLHRLPAYFKQRFSSPPPTTIYQMPDIFLQSPSPRHLPCSTIYYEGITLKVLMLNLQCRQSFSRHLLTPLACFLSNNLFCIWKGYSHTSLPLSLSLSLPSPCGRITLQKYWTADTIENMPALSKLVVIVANLHPQYSPQAAEKQEQLVLECLEKPLPWGREGSRHLLSFRHGERWGIIPRLFRGTAKPSACELFHGIYF